MNSNGQQEALKRIEAARLNESTELDLSSLNLAELPQAVADLTQLTELDCSGNQLKDLSALANLTQLTELVCSDNQLTDLSALVNLTQLTTLVCSRNQLTDLSALVNLTQLTELYCSDNPLTDLSGLAKLIQLTTLVCSGNPLNDLSALVNLTQLTELDCSGNQLTDLSGLAKLIQLTTLNCSFNQLTDLSTLAKLIQLTTLDCSRNQLTDLSGLAKLIQLTTLVCSGNPLNDLSALVNLTQLTELDCSGNQLTDLSGLAKLTQLTTLNCSFNQLTDLSGLAKLIQLTTLGCSGNQLKDLSALANLTQLTELVCSDNQLTDLSALVNLTQLTTLVCSRNQLTDLSALVNLTQLTELYCSGNQLTDLSGLAKLIQLTTLDCSRNQLTDLSGLAKLIQLTTLVCSGNPLNDLSALVNLTQLTELDCSGNQLTDLSGLAKLTQLTTLDCSHNQLTNSVEIQTIVENNPTLISVDFRYNPIQRIPKEFLDSLKILKGYFADLKQGAIENKQIKLLLLGNGRVGKTTLAYCLEHQQAPLEGTVFESTHGIIVKDITLPCHQGGNPWQLRLWDFAGQEIYHATHRLFYTSNALYLVLWAEETDEIDTEHDHELIYWLDLVQLHAEDAEIIVIKNQLNRRNELGLQINELQQPPYNHLQHYGISANVYQGVRVVEAAIVDALEQLVNNLPTLPITWHQVREALDNTKDHYISYDDYCALCKENQVGHPDVLLDYLHQTGSCFYFGSDFNNHIILDQNWAIKAIYRLFEKDNKGKGPRHIIHQKHGEITGNEALALFSGYSQSEVEIFFNFMRGSHLCFSQSQWSAFGKQQFVFPSLLPESHPELEAYTYNAKFEYKITYPWLHRLLVERFIIHARHLAPKKTWWRNGIAVIDRELKSAAALVADSETKSIHIYASGQNPTALLKRILKSLDELNLCQPIEHLIKEQGSEWVDIEEVKKAHQTRTPYVVAETGENVSAVSLFDALEYEDVKLLSEVPETTSEQIQHFTYYYIKEAKKVENTGNKVTIENSENIRFMIKGDINIGANNSDKQAKIGKLEELINLLQAAPPTTNSEDAIRYLKNTVDEVSKSEPNKTLVETYLNTASGFLNMIDKGSELFKKGKELFESFGFSLG
ncbi:leucine-rich repeat domain-containing protein [Spartinivicinus ruber]|uniref:leucine-rich repeat domain-containing protein n=1 Tax=Spartinivicinus ruber TaxID=2683272 RepID=UPI0013D88C79|nr:leucine-rich repeat domain-containing protein [Spartinivicinus ruber]